LYQFNQAYFFSSALFPAASLGSCRFYTNTFPTFLYFTRGVLFPLFSFYTIQREIAYVSEIGLMLGSYLYHFKVSDWSSAVHAGEQWMSHFATNMHQKPNGTSISGIDFHSTSGNHTQAQNLELVSDRSDDQLKYTIDISLCLNVCPVGARLQTKGYA